MKIRLYLSKLDFSVSIIEAVMLIIMGFIGIALQIGWGINVMNKMKIAFNTRRRINLFDHIDSGSQAELVKCEKNVLQGKYLMAMLLLETFSFVCYWPAFLYPTLHQVIPDIERTSFPYNDTCISAVVEDTIWISEFRYLPTAFFLSLGKSAVILTMGVAANFLRFIYNTYVRETWKIKSYRPIKYTAAVSLMIFIPGIIPQLIILSHAVFMIVFPIFFYPFVKYWKLLTKVMKWREDDLYHENEILLLKLHKKENKYFRFMMKCVLIALLLFFLTNALVFSEMLLSIILYYGKCFFPVLYRFHYSGLLTDEQLPILSLFIISCSIAEKLILTVGTCIYALPYIVITFILIINYLTLRKKTVYHYSLKEKLIS